MDAFKTHGAFSWSELTTPDVRGAAEFYGALFGWTVEALDVDGMPYHVVKAGDVAVGGLMEPAPDAPAVPPSWGVYVTVEDCDEAADRCCALGGAVLMGPSDVPGVGRMAVLRDPQGAMFSVIAYLPQP